MSGDLAVESVTEAVGLDVEVVLATALRRDGHDVHTVVEEQLAGERDPAVVAAATDEGRLLLALDRGIGDLRRYPPGRQAGVLVLRQLHKTRAASWRSSNDS